MALNDVHGVVGGGKSLRHADDDSLASVWIRVLRDDGLPDFLLLGRWRVRLPLRSKAPRHLNDVSQLQRIGAFESSTTLSSLLIFSLGCFIHS